MASGAFSITLDRMKESFLLAAAQGGNVQDCESLLEFGADINFRGPEGDTPLLAAVRRGHLEAVKTLIVRGADVNIPGNDSFAPIHIAAKRGDFDSLNMILDANPDVNLKTKDGLTALEIARSKGHEEISSRLNVTTTQRRNLPITITPIIKPIIEIEKRHIINEMSQKSPRLPSLHRPVNRPNGNRPNSLEVFDPDGLESSKTTREQYTILNPTTLQQQGQDEVTNSLRKLLDREQREHKAAELKILSITSINQRLVTEVTDINKSYEQLKLDNNKILHELLLLRGDLTTIKTCNLNECINIEKQLKLTIENIDKHKNYLLTNEIGNQREQRLCVICCEKEKSVVLLPCRHMCLCDVCASYDDLHQCPLCRKNITNRISVFA